MHLFENNKWFKTNNYDKGVNEMKKIFETIVWYSSNKIEKNLDQNYT